MSLKGASEPRISPDGRFVAYVQSEADWTSDGNDREIWVAEVATGRTLQLTNAANTSWAPAWSPDGSRLYFLSDRNGAVQIYAAPSAGGDTVQVLNVEGGVGAFALAPNGRRLVYLTSKQAPGTGPRPEETQGRYRVAGHEAKFTSALWMVDLTVTGAAAAPMELLNGEAYGVDDPIWSPDSQRIAFTTFDFNAADTLDTYNIRALNLANRSVTTVADRPGPDLWPVWSPDSTRIAFRTLVRNSSDPYFEYSFGYIGVAPARGGATRILAADFDERPTPVGWSRDGIYFAARQRTEQHLFRVDPATGAITKISGPLGSRNSAFSFNADFSTAAFMRADATSLPEVAAANLASFQPTDLTHYTQQLSGWTLGTRELVQWRSRDGLAIEGVLVKPPGFDPSRRYPLLVVLHSGPQEIDTLGYYVRYNPYPVEQFAARGALVLLPNYRGSIGYGREFAAALVRSMGRQQYEDVIGGVDALVARGIVDTDRIGAMGWSAGGYIAAYIATYSNRFRAVSMGASVSDFRHFYSVGGGRALSFERGYFVKAPWEDPDYYRETAPITYIGQARTPSLIQHCENDGTAPVISAHELYRGLRERNVPVELVLFPNCTHLPAGLTQYRAAVQQNYDWFDRWILGSN